MCGFSTTRDRVGELVPRTLKLFKSQSADFTSRRIVTVTEETCLMRKGSLHQEAFKDAQF